ncbi:hypothetical protein E4U60_006032 [Claviceps pazoutovae]|uniref:Uncharacterized protein n=1 Tax=Claviceps pazoutovae TaxID=1649127 RepID=A0A9P7SJY6_9HYPO|nr:hypothetical protein E4U60_006032 [Claviceps pazoutovae]
MAIAGRDGPSADEDSGLVDRNQVDGVMAMLRVEMDAEPTKSLSARGRWHSFPVPAEAAWRTFPIPSTKSLGDGTTE